MNRLALWKKLRGWVAAGPARQMLELGLSLLVGLLLGILMVLAQGFSSSWQGFIVMITVATVIVMLVDDLDKVVLAAIAISAPLNLDVSLIISQYSGNPENIARGNRILIALTELRLSFAIVVVVLGYALWIIKDRGSRREPVRFFSSTTIPALCLVFLSILSVFQAQDRQLALFRVAQLVELFLIYFYVANHIRTVKDLEFFVLVSTIGMLAEGILMIIQWITGLEFIIAGIEATTLGPGRVGGTFGNPGPAGGYLAAHILITGMLLWISQKGKGLVTLSLLIGTLAMIGTGSRISWGAFAPTVAIFVWVGIRQGWIKYETLMMLIIVVLIIGGIFFTTIYQRYTADDDDSAGSRTRMYKLAWSMIRAHPWLGVGAGNYALKTREYYTPGVGNPDGVLDVQVHNRYLLVWSESGTVALVAFVSFFGIAIFKAFSCANSDHCEISVIGAGLGSATVSLCIQMLTATVLGRSYILFVWLLPALVAGCCSFDRTALKKSEA